MLRSPTRIARPAATRLGGEPCRHLVDERELVGELVVDRRIRLVAAGGNVEIVDLEPVGAAAEPHPHVARVALGAEVARDRLDDRQPRDDGDAVIALLAVERDVLVAELAELAERELPVRAFRLLQAERVGRFVR